MPSRPRLTGLRRASASRVCRLCLLCCLALVLPPVAPAGSQVTPGEEERLSRRTAHGLALHPRELVHRLMADSAALDRYAAMLRGERLWIRGADSATALYYLAIENRSARVPLFLRFAVPSVKAEPSLVYQIAVGGLALHLDVPAARDRLLRLGRSDVSASHRRILVNVLAPKGTPASRELLARVSTDGLSPDVRRLISEARRPR